MQLRTHAHLALITDGFPACQRNKIKALGLATWLNPIVVTDELGIGSASHIPNHSNTSSSISHPFNKLRVRRGQPKQLFHRTPNQRLDDVSHPA